MSASPQLKKRKMSTQENGQPVAIVPISNLLIKGYAAAGDINAARATFEAMLDPPDGVAAPNNHVPHGASENQPPPAANSPVYREVSDISLTVDVRLLTIVSALHVGGHGSR